MPASHRRHSASPLRFFAIGGAVLLPLAGFAFAAGWIGPSRVSGGTVADALEYNAGRHPGYRRAHAKGMCISGHFNANGQGVALSRAHVFRPGRYPVSGRLSTGGGNPLATDGRNVFHAIGLRIVTPDGQEWRTAMDHTPIFPVADVRSFVALQVASRPDPATGKPVPSAMTAYLAGHPETQAFMDYMKTARLPDSFANGTYYSINAFRFIARDGGKRFVRWSLVPEDRFVALDKNRLADMPGNFLFDGMIRRLKQGPVRWHMVVTVAQPGDVTDNATVQWPQDRRKVTVGTLVIDHYAPEENGDCRDFTYDPTILPPGIAISDDPLLAARSAAYAASLGRRAGEEPGASAIGREFAVQRQTDRNGKGE